MDETPDALPKPEAPRNQEGGLKPREQETAGELRRLDPHLAGLYERGLALLRQINRPGNVYLAAHAGRELSRGVLNLLLSDEEPEVATEDFEKAQLKQRHLPRIAKILGLEKHDPRVNEFFQLVRQLSSTLNCRLSGPQLSNVCKAWERFISLLTGRSKQRNRPRIAKVLGLEPVDPRVDEWFHLVGQFSEACHWRPGGPESSTVREAFERFASLLYGRLAPYYSTEAELDEFLAIKTPTREHAKQLRDLQLRHGQRNYFFRQLSNPGWVRHLADEGFFKRPPGRTNNADGSSLPKVWPEGEYLVLAAPDEPEAVLEVLNSIPQDNNNPWVWILVAKAARHLPQEMAACIFPSLTNALRNSPAWGLSESVVDLIETFAKAGQEECFKLASFLLRVVDPSEVRRVEGLRFRRPSDWAFPCLGWFDSSKFLERVVNALEALNAKKTLALLFSKFGRLQQLADDPDLGRNWWLVDTQIESYPDYPDVMATLLNEAVGVGQRLASRGRDEASWVMKLVDQHPNEFVTQIGYLVLSEAGQHLQERLDKLLRSNVLREPGRYAAEIAVLFRSQFQNASPEARKEYAATVEAGPEHSQRRILTFFRGEIPEELCDLAKRLGVLGSTPSLLDQKVAEVGWCTGPSLRDGDESLISAEELAKSSVGQIVAFLVEWSPGDGKGSSFEMQETVRRYSMENPGTALIILKDALGQGVDSILIEGILNGLYEAATVGSNINWATVLAVLRRILRYLRSFDPPPLRSRFWEVLRRVLRYLRSFFAGRDPRVDQWRRTTGRAFRLLEVGCDWNSIAPEQIDGVWEILGEAMTVPAIWKVPHNDDPSLESVVVSTFNDVVGNAAHAAISAGLWHYRSLLGDERKASKEIKANARASVQKHLGPMLDRWLEENGPNAPVVRAVMGEYLTKLHLLVPEWIEAHVGDLFDHGLADPASSPTWTTYISHCALFNDVFRVTRPWYLKAAENAKVWREAVGDSSRLKEITKNYCEHLIRAFLRGLVSVGDEDALLETAYKNFLPSDWHQPYWGIFCSWSELDGPPPPDFVQRLLSLWEWRISQLGKNPDSGATEEEAKELGWFFHTPYIPDKDRVRLGLETARLAKGQLQMYSRWDKMLSLAQTYPDETFSIVEAVLLAQLHADPPHVPVEDVRPFLAHILRVGSPDTQDRACHLINRLGERGYRQLKDLLEETG